MRARSLRGTSARPVGRWPSSEAGEGVHQQGAQQLEDFRRLIVGPEQARLDRLEQRPVVGPETIGSVLPEAVGLIKQDQAGQLALALEPSVASAVRSVSRREPELFAEMLAPTIGAAVRKAIAEAIAAMLQRFNEALEHSLSIRSLQWRLEARRTQRPFGEVVLLHTLIYSVDQVFLIHPGTGLLLQHVVAENRGVAEPDQVAAMLEAIDAFVREAFRPQPPGVHLDHARVGDVTVWVERDPWLAVAAVVRGVAPEEFGGVLREAHERIYLGYQKELANFQADVTPFVTTRSTLADCLRAVRRPPPERARIWLVAAAALLIVGLLGYGLRRHAHAAEDARVLNACLQTLESEPGLAITSAQRVHGHVRISGFRDPLARPPEQLLARRGLLPAELHFEPFYSLDPRVAEKRIVQSLRPPPGVSLTLHDGVLSATGVAPHDWIERTRLLANTLPDVERFDGEGLLDAAAIQSERTARALEATELQFAPGSTRTLSPAVLAQAASLFRHLSATAAGAHRRFCVSIIGHTDPTGTEEGNQALSQARASQVVKALRPLDPLLDNLRPVAGGVWAESDGMQRGRSVTFRVDLEAGCPESG